MKITQRSIHSLRYCNGNMFHQPVENRQLLMSCTIRWWSSRIHEVSLLQWGLSLRPVNLKIVWKINLCQLRHLGCAPAVKMIISGIFFLFGSIPLFSIFWVFILTTAKYLDPAMHQASCRNQRSQCVQRTSGLFCNYILPAREQLQGFDFNQAETGWEVIRDSCSLVSNNQHDLQNIFLNNYPKLTFPKSFFYYAAQFN